MAVTLGQGFRPYLLRHLVEIAGQSSPQFKMEPLGFINFLQSQSKPRVLRLDNAAGHRETVQVRYKQRLTTDFVTSDLAACDTGFFNPRREVSVDLSTNSVIALYLEDETIAQYEDEASRTVAVGQPATDMMNELLDDIYGAANALLQDQNQKLLTVLSANIGVNRRTGLNTAAALNINQNADTNLLTSGLTLLLSDYKLNRGSGMPEIIGAGLFNNFMLQQAAKSTDQMGLNTAIQAAGVKFYYDLDVAAAFGANEIIVAQPDSVQMVEYLRYTGFKAGAKPGSSIFGTMTLPMMLGTEVIPVDFDFQLRYVDCARTITETYYGESITMQKGWNLIISKSSGLFTIPADAYRGGDPLLGNRGTLLYDVTNDCENCAS